MLKQAFGVFSILAVGCYAGVESEDFENREINDEVEEIVDNLKTAGFPDEEIGVLEDGTVYVGMDAVVSLEASREMAGVSEFRQYRTNNLVDSSVGTICIDGSDFSGTLSTALNNAIANYNGEGLSFTMTRTNGPEAGCDALITAVEIGGSGGSAGFPSGGLPYDTINLGSGVASYGVAVATHVVQHEIGHCIGFRHTDYFNRSISCGGGYSNEGSAGVGAVHIPGTPTGAELDGSVMNSCFNLGSDGVWTPGDEAALAELYGPGGGGDGGGDGGDGGGDGPTCEAKGSSCSSNSDCCSNKCRGKNGNKSCK